MLRSALPSCARRDSVQQRKSDAKRASAGDFCAGVRRSCDRVLPCPDRPLRLDLRSSAAARTSVGSSRSRFTHSASLFTVTVQVYVPFPRSVGDVHVLLDDSPAPGIVQRRCDRDCLSHSSRSQAWFRGPPKSAVFVRINTNHASDSFVTIPRRPQPESLDRGEVVGFACRRCINTH